MTDPTPQERADYIVRKLELFIQEGKSARGMSFKTWQAMARAEIQNAFADVEQRQRQRAGDVTIRRILTVIAVSLVTIGFWGGLIALDKSYTSLAAGVIILAGLVLLIACSEWGFQGMMGRTRLKRRAATMGRIVEFDVELKRLENEIWRKLEKARKDAL